MAKWKRYPKLIINPDEGQYIFRLESEPYTWIQFQYVSLKWRVDIVINGNHCGSTHVNLPHRVDQLTLRREVLKAAGCLWDTINKKVDRLLNYGKSHSKRRNQSVS